MCYEIYIAPNKPLKTIQWGENNRKLYVSWEGEKEKGPLKTICLTEKDVGRQFNLSPTLYIENTINKTFKSSKSRSNFRLVKK